MNSERMLEENRKCWNIDFKSFNGWCCLPSWGPYEVGSNLNLLEEIRDKHFLEIACGSGHSIKFLLDQGASEVIGIDFSQKQLELAKEVLSGYSHYELIESSMEEKQPIRDMDCVFSIYGLGWSTDIHATLKNIYSYLAVGGKFIFSWDHSFFTCISQKENCIQVTKPYYGNEITQMSNWGEDGDTAYVTNNTLGTWHKLLRENGFEVEQIIEPTPFNLKEQIEKQGLDIASYYSRDKVALIPPTLIFVCKKI